MPWFREPKWGAWLHLAVSVAPILLNILIAYIADPSNPLGLRADVLAGVVTLLNVLLSQLRNHGQTTAILVDPARTGIGTPDLAAGDSIIVSVPSA